MDFYVNTADDVAVDPHVVAKTDSEEVNVM